MELARWYLLNTYPEFYKITPEEAEEGWHHCEDFDYLVVGPGTPEWKLCKCGIEVDCEEDTEETIEIRWEEG